MREEWLDSEAIGTAEGDNSRASAAARLAILGGRMALERFGHVDVSWGVLGEEGTAHQAGTPLTFVAGNPLAHCQALADLH
jgi:hypothetical protein